jgi:hypothetical protein
VISAFVTLFRKRPRQQRRPRAKLIEDINAAADSAAAGEKTPAPAKAGEDGEEVTAALFRDAQGSVSTPSEPKLGIGVRSLARRCAMPRNDGALSHHLYFPPITGRLGRDHPRPTRSSRCASTE